MSIASSNDESAAAEAVFRHLGTTLYTYCMVPRGTVSFVFPRVRIRGKTKLTSFPIFIIPSEFLFLIEVIKAYYYISYYFFMYFKTFVS